MTRITSVVRARSVDRGGETDREGDRRQLLWARSAVGVLFPAGLVPALLFGVAVRSYALVDDALDDVLRSLGRNVVLIRRGWASVIACWVAPSRSSP
jgi:hypothetical protein